MLGFLAFVVSIAVAGAAWAQVHIARQKLVLDLFERRSTLYAEYWELAGRLSMAAEPERADVSAHRRLVSRMRLLFGDEVIRHLQEASNALSDQRIAEASRQGYLRQGRDDLAAELLNRAIEAEDEFEQRMNGLEPLISPYLRMDQKLPRSPRQWLADAWRNRPDGTT